MVQLAAVLLMVWVLFGPVYRLSMRAGMTSTAQRGSALHEAVTERHEATPCDDLLGHVIPHGPGLDDYVRNGIADLRIMLVQHARRADPSA